MSITIEAPTAEVIFEAIKRQIPSSEFERLRSLFTAEKPGWEDPTFSSEWSEEDLQDLNRYTARLIDERFGPEAGDYD